MVFSCRRLLLVLVLLLGCENMFAADSAKEERAYAAAVGAFQDGMWSRAETQFAQFLQKYPDSNHAPEAVLLQAQAEYKQGKLSAAIALLSDHLGQAGTLADEYVYWKGEAQLQGSNDVAAVATFTSLAGDFPASRFRLNAVVESAAALVRLGRWAEAVALLQKPDGVFQTTARSEPDNDLVARGRLLLAQALFAQKDYADEFEVLTALAVQSLPPELDGQRAYLLYQNRLATGDLPEALAATTNLTQIARGQNSGIRLAEATAFRAEVLERMNRLEDAAAVYRENLATNTPVVQRRQAIFKVAELALAQDQFTNAEQQLTGFLAQFTDVPSRDIALLTLGELHLKQYVIQPALTNELLVARTNFDQFIAGFTNSPWLGKAYLDRGWCDLLASNLTQGVLDFQTAVQLLPASLDQAVARFKLGDALFRQQEFRGALTNYQAVADDFTNFPVVTATLGEQALYQSLRVCEALNDLPGANAVLKQILSAYPAGDLADNAILLYGEEVAAAGRPALARSLFERFETQFPNSELLPQAQLAIARTYEQEQNWTNAISDYLAWQVRYPTNELQPQVAYALALANYQAGDETNAYLLFTNFVAQFPTNRLAPQAQWWVGDYFFRLGDDVAAERNYKYVFQNWPASELTDQAKMMAGRAAVARSDYAGAIRDYFSKLEADTNCDVKLRVQATFAHGDALMRSDSTDTNNPLANFSSAINVFYPIVQLYPTNEWGALANFYIGECNLQLANYDAATNAFAQAFNSPAAGLGARSQAKIGFGIALEKKAALAAGPAQMALWRQALNSYRDVFDTNLDGDTNDFWIKKAGMQMLVLLEQPGMTNLVNANEFIDHMERLFPQAKDALEKKRAALLSGKN